MATEEYSVGYNEGYQDGWNAALEPTQPSKPEQNKYEAIEAQFVFIDGAAKNPFQREWVSLTDADIASLENIHETHGLDVRNIAQIINSLLRDRNK